MKQDKVIQSCRIFLFLTKWYFLSLWDLIKLCIPFLFELLLAHEAIIFDAHMESKGRTITTYPYLLVYFTHIPFELFRIRWNVEGYYGQK